MFTNQLFSCVNYLLTSICLLLTWHIIIMIAKMATRNSNLGSPLKNPLNKIYYILENNQYFNVTLDNKKVMIKCLEHIPDEVYQQKPVIALQIDVMIKNTNHHARTVVNINLSKLHIISV